MIKNKVGNVASITIERGEKYLSFIMDSKETTDAETGKVNKKLEFIPSGFDNNGEFYEKGTYAYNSVSSSKIFNILEETLTKFVDLYREEE